MDKNELKIVINDIGSIKRASLNIKDLTGILGLPNSGKSYALRSIYWFLQLLDNNRYSEIKNLLVRNTFSNEIINFKSLENNKAIEEEIKNRILEYINRFKPGTKLNYNDEIIYNSELQISLKLNVENLSKLMRNVFKITMNDYVNNNKLSSIKINGKDMNTIIRETAHDIFKGKKNISLLEKIESIYLPARNRGSAEYYDMTRILRRYPIKMIIKDIKSDLSDSNISLNFNLTLITNKNNSGLNLYNLIENENIFNNAHNNINNQYTWSFISKILSRIKEYIINSYLDSIKLSISDISGLNSIKFIPYGRNIIVQLFNNSIKTSIYGPGNTLDILDELKNAPFSSYFKWLDIGRKSIDNVDENVRLFFQFIMNGSIGVDSNSGGFTYTYSKDKSVDLNLSSAMVEEIAGIMLPVISSQEGDLIIIEEPEAQLHITTQIIMGILLIYIAQKMHIKLIFSTHSDTMAFIIQHIINSNIKNDDIKQLMKTVYTGNIPDIKFNMSSKPDDELIFYYIKEGIAKQVTGKDLQSNIPGISDVIDELFNWAFNSLREPTKGDTN